MVFGRTNDNALWLKVFSPSGEFRDYIREVFNVQIRRRLDESGTFSLQVPLNNQRVHDALTEEARVEVYVMQNDVRRYVFAGIIKSITITTETSEYRLNISGSDDLIELADWGVDIGREYQETFSYILNHKGFTKEGILKIPEQEWTATFNNVSGLHYTRLDGMSVLKALQKIAREAGYHFRVGDTQRTLEFGQFGEWNDIVLLQGSSYTRLMNDDPHVGFLERFIQKTSSTDICNRIYPLGSGDGDARLTLEDATLNTPYTRKTKTGPDGRTIYYLEDEESINIYGVREKWMTFDVAVQSNTDTDLESAANTLYVYASAYLKKHKDRFVEYTASVRGVRANIKVGDKVHLTYKGFVEDDDGNLLPPVDINQKLWVTAVTETFNIDSTYRLTLSNVDRHAYDTVEAIIQEFENFEFEKLSIKAKTSRMYNENRQEIDPSHDVVMPIVFSDRVLRIRQVILRLKTSPLRSTASSALSTGHNHVHMRIDDNISPGTFTEKTFSIFDDTSGNVYYFKAETDAPTPVTFEMTTSGTHTHDLDFKIKDDTTYPGDVEVWINGNDKTTELGGPFGSVSGDLDVTLDITDYILLAANIRQIQEVTLKCGSGQGLISVAVEVYEDIQNRRIV